MSDREDVAPPPLPDDWRDIQCGYCGRTHSNDPKTRAVHGCWTHSELEALRASARQTSALGWVRQLRTLTSKETNDEQ